MSDNNYINALRQQVKALAAHPDGDALERIEALEQLVAALDESRRVVITIHRGIPEITQCPDGIDVEIWDYDTDGMHPDELDELVKDDSGREYFLREG